jgi:hypothetical protein
MSKKTESPKTETTPEVDPVPTAEPAPAPTEIPTNLDLDDIQKLIKLVDIAAERGVLKPVDFTAIGTTYNKLVQILKSVSAK